MSGSESESAVSTITTTTRRGPTASAASRSSTDLRLECYLCGELLDRSPKPHTAKGCSFHLPCYNAVRCHQRLCKKQGLNADAQMLFSKEEWVKLVLPLRASPDGSRDTNARAQVKQKLIESVTLESKETINDMLILNKVRFKNYRKFWDNDGSDTASEAFDDLGARQSWRYSGKDKQVGVRDNPIQRVRTATQHVVREQAYDPTPGGGASDAGSGRGGRDDAMRRGRPSRRDTSDFSSAKKQKRHGDSNRRRTRRRSRTPPREMRRARRHRPPSPSPDDEMDSDSSAARDDGDDEDFSDGEARPSMAVAGTRKPPKSAIASAPSSRSASVAHSTRKLSPSEFVQAKADMTKRAQCVLADGVGAKCVRMRIKTMRSKLTGEQWEQLDEDPSETIKELQKLDAELEKKKVAMEKVKAAEWGTVAQGVEDAMQAILDKRADAEEIYKALSILEGFQAKATKAVANTYYYKKTRVSNKINIGGYPNMIAKATVAKLEELAKSPVNLIAGDIAMDPTTFDPDKVTKWAVVIAEDGSIDDGQQSEVIKQTKEFVQSCGTSWKPASLTKALREKTSWPSAMAKIETDGSNGVGMIKPFAGSRFLGAAGSEPWMCVMRTHAWRFGPHQVPLPGCATIVSTTTADTELYIIAVPMGGFLKLGISTLDLKAFLSTDAGLEYYQQSAVMMRLRPGDLAYIPFGWITIPLALSKNALVDLMKESAELEKGKKKQKKVKDQEENDNYTFCIFGFVPQADWAKRIPSPTFTALSAMNDEFLQTVADRRTWSSRATFWGEFCAEVLGST